MFLSGEAANANFIVLLGINCIWGEHANHYTANAAHSGIKEKKKPIKIRLWHINSNIRRLNNIVQNIIIDLASCIAGYEKSKDVKNVNEMLHDVTQYRELFDVSGFLDKNIKIIILKYMTIILKKKLHKKKNSQKYQKKY